MKVRRIIFGGLAAIFLVAIGAAGALYWNPGNQVYGIYSSPGGNYHVIVYRHRSYSYLPVMPGQGSHGPGFARVYDASGKLLGSAEIDIVGNTEVRWYASEVCVQDGACVTVPEESVSKPETQPQN